MSHADIILLIILGGFSLFGLWFGFIHTLGSLIGTVFGAYVSSHYYGPISSWVWSLTGGNENLVKFIVFILIFIIANRLVGFVFWLIEKLFNIIKIIPFLSTINRLLGFVFGLAEGTLFLGLTLFFVSKFPFSDWVINSLLKSEVANSLIKISSVLWPLLPAALKQIQAVIL
ncbi:MAG TPA: CvpA family protein [Candidatus Magasanikbacteria bacterium]|nr:CvpA family protein [Candidatus Magasanikbacteria bacterium]